MSYTNGTARTTMEFTRLMNFFDKLAAHRSCSGCQTAPIVHPEDAEVYIPKDIAPLLYNLKSHVVNRTQWSTQHRGSSSPGSLLQEIQMVAFPMDENYPFTFKMRLHELYELEDWAKKINEEVEKSQLEYRSLEEQEKQGVSEDGRLSTQRTRVTSSTGRLGRRSTADNKRSSHSLSKRSSRMFAPLSPRTRTSVRPPAATRVTLPNKMAIPFPKQGSGLMTLRLADHARATKKRCVGRTKSMTSGTPPVLSGDAKNPETEVKKVGWLYQGIVSSMEMEKESRRPTPRVSQSGTLEKVGSNDKKCEFRVLGRSPPARQCIGRRRATISGPMERPLLSPLTGQK